MRPEISPRAKAMPASPIRKLMPLADQAKARGVHVYHLNIGQPDLETPAEFRAKLQSVDRVIAYTPSGGTAGYLDALGYYYRQLGIELTPQELIATTAGSEAILFALFAVSSEGDEALTCEPYYTNYNSYATMAGVKIVPLTTRGEDGFHLPPREAWEQALTPRTKLFILCNPNNPTGTVYTREEVQEVAEFCRDHGLFLISDEVYREFVYDERVAVSALTLAGFEEHVVVVDSLSKRYSACGIRLGCLATRNRDVHQAALRMAQGRLSPPGLAQLMATAIPEIPPGYYAAMRDEYRVRRDVLFAGLTKIPGVFLRKPEGAFYFVARLPVDDSDDFARFLLAEFEHDGKTVMVAPARGFYATPGLAQLMATAIPEIPPGYYAAMRDEYRVRRDVLFAGLTKIPGVFLRKPEGAFYFVARLPVDDSDDFARFLLAEFEHDGKTVMVAPARGFYATPGLGGDEVRIAYVLKRDDLERAVEVFGVALERYRSVRRPEPVAAVFR